MEKIEAMELAGAVILMSSKSPSKFPRAFDYWRRAFQLRQMEKEETRIPLQRESGGTVEWVTSEDLERVIQDPTEHKIQAFLVGLRILSSRSARALSALLDCDSLKGYRIELTNQREFLKLLHLSWATLETLGRYEEDDESYDLDLTSVFVKQTTSYLVKTLSYIGPNMLTVETITTSLQHISDTDHILFNYSRGGSYVEENFEEDSNTHMKTLLKLVTLLARLPRQTLDQIPFKESFKSFVQRARRNEDYLTLLQMACQPSYLSFNPSRMATIRLLLETGADPNAVDCKGDAPLHILAQSDHQKHGDLVAVAAGILLDQGAHLDQVNNSRKTAADVWIDLQKEKRERLRNRTEENDDEGSDDEEDDEVEPARWKDLLPSWLRDNSVPKLQCLTGRIIRSHKVPFSRLPPSLKRFVKIH